MARSGGSATWWAVLCTSTVTRHSCSISDFTSTVNIWAMRGLNAHSLGICTLRVRSNADTVSA